MIYAESEGHSMSLKKYIGTKIIEAEPVVRLDGEFIQPADFTIPKDVTLSLIHI